MRKIFDVELSARNGGVTELALPATPYTMLDALEKLELEEGESPEWELLRTHDCGAIVPFLDSNGSLFELNALTQQLQWLSERELAAVEGMARMEHGAGSETIPMPRLIDMAYSTDRCHIVDEATDDYTLGRFAAEYGFVPGAEDVADNLYEMLDFSKIGRDFRESGGGVFTGQGYVQRHDELRQVYETLDLTPKKPGYTILAETSTGCEVRLPYPANDPMGTEPVRIVDCAAPSLIGASGGMERMDLLARRLLSLEKFGELSKYKAVLETEGRYDLDSALPLVDWLDQYTFSPGLRTAEELAQENLRLMLGEDEMELMLPHLNLYAYGQALLEHFGAALTEYGSVERADREQIQSAEQEPVRNGMEMSL